MSPSFGSSTRTARRPSSRATGPGRPRCTCGARAGRTQDEFSILTKAGEIRPTITAPRHRDAGDGQGLAHLAGLPSGGPDGTGTLTAGGREWRFQHVSIGNPQCVIEAGEEVEELDLARDRPRDRAQRPVPEPHQRLVHPRRRLDGQRADLRARGGGDALLRDRRQRGRRGGGPSRARPARSRCGWTAAS